MEDQDFAQHFSELKGDQLWGGDHRRLLLRHLCRRLPGEAGPGGHQQHRPLCHERVDHHHEHCPLRWQRLSDGPCRPGICARGVGKTNSNLFSDDSSHVYVVSRSRKTQQQLCIPNSNLHF